MDSTVAASEVTQPPGAPLSTRYTWVALVIAAALPLVLLATVILILVSANYNFLEWME